MEPIKVHAALLASPGMGHLIPMIELGRLLVAKNNFHLTIFVITCNTSTEQSLLPSAMAATSNLLDIVQLLPVDISPLINSGAAVSTQVAMMVRKTIPSLRVAISAMEVLPSAFIVDHHGTEALAVADEFQMVKIVYVPTNAWCLALILYSPTLDKIVEGEYVDQEEPITIPGCNPVRPDDLVDPMLNRKSEEYIEYIRSGVEMRAADAILVNTWEELEPTAVAAQKRITEIPVYPVGPIVSSYGSKHAILQWLDKQPDGSVIYVCFGSGGTLSQDQITELAFGLELSKQSFVWVVHAPLDGNPSGSYLTLGKSMIDPKQYLPEGFLTRTRNVGMVIANWAPQGQILSHPSIGGFITHCGWNSVLESISNGIPMIAWPLYAEQRMNAVILVEDLRVAVRLGDHSLKGTGNATTGRRDIGSTVRRVMVEDQGREMRSRVAGIKASAKKAFGHGGSSEKSLFQVANLCMANLHSQQENVTTLHEPSFTINDVGYYNFYEVFIGH